MKITKEQIIYVANLAHLELDEKAIEKFSTQIGEILEYVEKLNQVDTANISQTAHALDLPTPLRDDEVSRHLDRESALANAPQKENGSFVVPKII